MNSNRIWSVQAGMRSRSRSRQSRHILSQSGHAGSFCSEPEPLKRSGSGSERDVKLSKINKREICRTCIALLGQDIVYANTKSLCIYKTLLFFFMYWPLFGWMNPEPSERAQFARSRSRNRRNILLGAGAGIVLRSRSRSRPKCGRLPECRQIFDIFHPTSPLEILPIIFYPPSHYCTISPSRPYLRIYTRDGGVGVARWPTSVARCGRQMSVALTWSPAPTSSSSRLWWDAGGDFGILLLNGDHQVQRFVVETCGRRGGRQAWSCLD